MQLPVLAGRYQNPLRPGHGRRATRRIGANDPARRLLRADPRSAASHSRHPPRWCPTTGGERPRSSPRPCPRLPSPRTSRIRRGGQCSSHWEVPSGATPCHRARRSAVQMRATPQGGGQSMSRASSQTPRSSIRERPDRASSQHVAAIVLWAGEVAAPEGGDGVPVKDRSPKDRHNSRPRRCLGTCPLGSRFVHPT